MRITNQLGFIASIAILAMSAIMVVYGGDNPYLPICGMFIASVCFFGSTD